MGQQGTRLVGGRQLVVVPGVESRVEGLGAAELGVQGSHGGGPVSAGVGGADERRIVHIGRVGGARWAAIQCVLVHCPHDRTDSSLFNKIWVLLRVTLNPEEVGIWGSQR